MFKVTFSIILLTFFLNVLPAAAQRNLPPPEERRRERERYNKKIEDPSNNPYMRGENADDRSAPGKVPKDKVLKLQPPKRTFLEIEISEVLDGDTVAIMNTKNQRLLVRLLGIDAPELEQEFGAEAKKNLEGKLAGKKVRLAFEPHGVPDAQGRILAKVLIDDMDISVEQVREGFAWYYEDHKERLGFLEIDELKQLQSAAKKERIKLWRSDSPQAPWKFRKRLG